MLQFLNDIDYYFRSRPGLYSTVFATLALFMIATVLLSAVCPPAALAIGIGGWSLIGNIIPLVATSLFAAFLLGTMATQIPQMFRSQDDDFTYIVQGLANLADADVKSKMSHSKAPQTTNNDLPVEHYDPLFAAEMTQTAEHTKTSDTPTHNNSL